VGPENKLAPCRCTGPGEAAGAVDAHGILGYIAHLILGVLFALGYALFFALVPGNLLALGFAAGIVHWLAVGWIFAFAPLAHAGMKAGLVQEPGPYMLRSLGVSGFVAGLLGHIAFRVVVGLVYGLMTGSFGGLGSCGIRRLLLSLLCLHVTCGVEQVSPHHTPDDARMKQARRRAHQIHNIEERAIDLGIALRGDLKLGAIPEDKLDTRRPYSLNLRIAEILTGRRHPGGVNQRRRPLKEAARQVV
jgi:hypothetical protein